MVTVKVAAEITGLTVKSIRYYESIGLLKPSPRTAGGYRLFSEDDIFRLQQIQYYKALKFSLKEIAEILDARAGDLLAVFQKQLKRIEQVQAEYERIHRILERAVGADDCGDVLNLEDLGSLRNPRRIAVIGIDLQNDFLENGALPCKRFPMLIEPLQQFYGAVRAQHIPILYICDNHRKGDPELEIWEDHAIEGTWGAEIVQELWPGPGDYVIKKRYFNGFIQTDLQKILDYLNVGTILFTGWRTHVCIAQTAIEAFHRGYRTMVVCDGVNSTTKEEHEFGLRLLQVNYGIEMVTCAEVLEEAAEAY